jgi:hypothetical protein
LELLQEVKQKPLLLVVEQKLLAVVLSITPLLLMELLQFQAAHEMLKFYLLLAVVVEVVEALQMIMVAVVAALVPLYCQMP